MKTSEFRWLKQKDNILGQEIIMSMRDRSEKCKYILDPYVYTQFKKCGTLNRVVEVYFAEHLISLGLDVQRHDFFDFMLNFHNSSLLIEVTTPSIVLAGKNDLEIMNSVAQKIIKSIDQKLRDYKRNIHDIANKKRGFVIAISCAKMNHALLIPTQYKPIIYSKVLEYIKSHPEISGVILSWCWYYYFPKIVQTHFGAVFGDKSNDLTLIKNRFARLVLPKDLSFGAQVIVQD